MRAKELSDEFLKCQCQPHYNLFQAFVHNYLTNVDMHYQYTPSTTDLKALAKWIWQKGWIFFEEHVFKIKRILFHHCRVFVCLYTDESMIQQKHYHGIIHVWTTLSIKILC